LHIAYAGAADEGDAVEANDAAAPVSLMPAMYFGVKLTARRADEHAQRGSGHDAKIVSSFNYQSVDCQFIASRAGIGEGKVVG
jgi:hypothetical protein